MSSVFAALALMLVIEGLMPLIAPSAWRETFRRIIAMRDGQLRFIGAASVAGGVLLYVFAV